MEHVKKTTLTLNERLTSIGIKYWTLVCLLASIDILGPLATDAHLPSLPHMTSDLHTSPSWIQFTILLYAFIMAISSLFGGILSDKYGRRNMTLFGLFIFICGGYGCTFSSSIWILNLCRFIQGIGGGISSIITSSVARDVFMANERIRVIGILGSIRPIGIGIAPMIGGWISSYYDWRMVFFITASVAVVVILLSLKLLPETKNRFFVNYHKIRILNTETNIIGNIDILNEENSTITTKSNMVVVCDDEEFEDSNSDTHTHTNHSDSHTQSEWSQVIPVMIKSDTSQSLIHSNGETTDLNTTNNTNNNNNYSIIKIACNDSILMSVSWIIAFRMVGVFIFLNEFPYVTHNDYHYSQSLTGLMIGIGSIFTILGASAAICINRNANSNSNSNELNTTERSALLFKLSPKNAKLSIMRFASIASLIACILLIIPPIIMHYSTFMTVLQINTHINHLELINSIYTGNPWYFLVIPFCILTFSQGLFIPPALVVVLEPYPHIAASISAILQFQRLILPTITLIIITQCLSFYTNTICSIVIHGCVGLCSFLCFVLMYGCISGHDVRLRMCGWQDRINKNMNKSDDFSSNSQHTYGTTNDDTAPVNIVTVMQSVDVSTSIPPGMDMSTFSLYTNTMNNNPVANTKHEYHNIMHNNHYLINNTIYDPFATSIPTMQF